MFTGALTEAQLPPANKLCGRQKMLLSWPQGTGKTVISLAASEKLLELKLIHRILILSPVSISWQWEEKIKEFTDHDVTLVEAKNKSSRSYGTHKSVYTIVPYSVFRRDYEVLLSQPYDVVIADEAQEFSSFRSKTFKLIKKFRTPYRWALTGTAISNKLEELYVILQWVDPGFLPRWPEFEKHHLIRNPKTKQILRYKNLESLNKYLLSKRVERKTIDELQDSLPKLVPYKIYVEKDKEVKQSEDTLLRTLTNCTVDTFAFDPEVSKALHQARQALCSPTKLNYAVALISDILAESDNNRTVIYSFYKQPIYELREYLSKYNIESVLFTGDQSSVDKQQSISSFRSGESRVLICSDAAKAGLDLPYANYTIHLDVPYSFGTMDQRSKRTQRVSSSFESVVVIYLLVKNSIEDYYYKVTSNKGKLATATLEGGDDSVVIRPSSLKAYLDGVRTKDSRMEASEEK